MWSGGFGPTFSESRFSDHFEPLSSTGDARATRVGPGRFSAYDAAGGLVDYVSMPVVEPATAMVLDDVACIEQPRVWLRGLPFSPTPVVLDPAGNPLVDLDATVSMEAPAGDTAYVLWHIGFGAGREMTETLAVVDAIQRIEPVLTPAQQLADGEALTTDGIGFVCFQAFADDAVVLGVPVSDAVADAPDALDVQLQGQCVQLGDDRDGPAPARIVHVTVSMAGATRTFDVHLRAITEGP